MVFRLASSRLLGLRPQSLRWGWLNRFWFSLLWFTLWSNGWLNRFWWCLGCWHNRCSSRSHLLYRRMIGNRDYGKNKCCLLEFPPIGVHANRLRNRLVCAPWRWRKVVRAIMKVALSVLLLLGPDKSLSIFGWTPSCTKMTKQQNSFCKHCTQPHSLLLEQSTASACRRWRRCWRLSGGR